DQIEAIHQASMHILENFGIEVMSRRALSLFEKAGATVDHATANVRVDRGMVEEALKTTRTTYTLTPRNPAKSIHLGGNTINFTLVAGPPNVHDMERGRRAGNLRDYADLTRLAQHFNCIHMLGNQVCAPVELPANSR
ncbi:methyltransferase, partial [Mesorhizobium sp. M00.F.Ca.ET.158.01.1.1]